MKDKLKAQKEIMGTYLTCEPSRKCLTQEEGYEDSEKRDSTEERCHNAAWKLKFCQTARRVDTKGARLREGKVYQQLIVSLTTSVTL